MQIETFALSGLKLINLNCFDDDRGFFVERFQKEKFQKADLPFEFVQDNFSRSKTKVLRGLHYQFDQPQGKLVTCMRGKILDVAVDIRAGSPTYGQHVTVELSEERPQWFWVPAGFAHGFVVLSEGEADVMYKVDNFYNSKGEGCIRWNDSDLAIDWKVQGPLLSEKDAVGDSFSDYKQTPKF